LLGLGTGDSGSVAAALTQTDEGENPSLTIIPDYQEKALAALAQTYKCPKGRGAMQPRADLVILDADGEDAGNVLAVASLPQPRTGMSSWDIETLELTAASKSPLAAYAWRNYDLRGTPGSSFKLITALAASQYVHRQRRQGAGRAYCSERRVPPKSPISSASSPPALPSTAAASPTTRNAIRKTQRAADPRRS
jgi:cell division protein FtsI/penicillin-binding protein 2